MECKFILTIPPKKYKSLDSFKKVVNLTILTESNKYLARESEEKFGLNFQENDVN